MSEEFNRIASALERIANSLEHLHIEQIDHAHIDDIGEIRTILRERFGPKVKLKFITKKKGFLSGILQSAFNPLISKIFDEIDNKAYWNRFGL